jgi:CubicO group peptidase (beta-lactamase class C family)
MNSRGVSGGGLPRWLVFAFGLWTSFAFAQDAALPPAEPPATGPLATELPRAEPPPFDAGVAPAAAAAEPAAPVAPEAASSTQAAPIEPPLPSEVPASTEPLPAPVEVPFTAELASELDAYLDAASAAFHVPGAAVALIQNGDVVYLGTTGVRDANGSDPVGLDTRFMIGSVTKSMTTTLAATLVGEGRLGWDDRVVDYLPGITLARPEWVPALALRDLFRHTSGVPRSDIELLIGQQRPLELLASVGAIAGAVAPGERYEYQNQMFSIGGFALASAVGAPRVSGALGFVYERLMQRRVFEPLDMARTTFDFDRTLRDADHASPHSYDAEAAGVRSLPLDTERALLQIMPAGAAWSDVVDMARYFAMHLREGQSLDGVQVVPEASLLETHTPQVPIQRSLSYGLGWLLDETPVGTLLTHDGGTAGFTARLMGVPSRDLGLVVLVNRSGGGSFLEAVTRYVFELTFGAPHAGDADLLEASAQLELGALELLAATAPVDAGTIAAYSGRYERQLAVSGAGEEMLISTVYGSLRFRAVSGMVDTFLCVDKAFLGFAALFSTDEQGAVTLSIGVADFQSGELVQPVRAARLGERLESAAPRGRAADFRQVPVPHLAPHRSPHLAPQLDPQPRHPWGPR